MGRQAYHITTGVADADHIKVAPEAWYNVGAVEGVYLKGIGSGRKLLVNTEEMEATAVALGVSDETAIQTGEPLTLYALGIEGQKFVTDDGAA